MKQINLIRDRRPRKYSETIEKQDGRGGQAMTKDLFTSASYGGTHEGSGGIKKRYDPDHDQSHNGQNMLVFQSGDQFGGSYYMTRKYNNQLNK